MKTILAMLALVSIATPALPQPRPDTTRMSCVAARALVVQRGAVVLSTGRFTYDRYVLHRGFCTPTEETEVTFVPTADNRSCYIGDLCVEKSRDIDP